MNFERSYVSNFQNLFEIPGGIEASTDESPVQASPRITNDFENRPILSFTIPTKDCASPGVRSKISFPATPHNNHHHKAEHRTSTKTETNETHNGERIVETKTSLEERRKKLSKLSCTPVVQTECLSPPSASDDAFQQSNLRPKTPLPERQKEDESSRVTRCNDELERERGQKSNGFARTSATRRSFHQGSGTQTRPSPMFSSRSSRTLEVTRTSGMSSTSSTSNHAHQRVTKEAFLSRINSIRDNKRRSKSCQREGSLEIEDGELLTDQTLSLLIRDGFLKPEELRPDDIQSQESDSSASTGASGSRPRSCRSDRSGLPEKLSDRAGSNRFLTSDTIREGLVSTPRRMVTSPSSPLVFVYPSPVRTTSKSPATRRKLFPSNSTDQSTPQDEQMPGRRQLDRYGSLRMPRRDSSQKRNYSTAERNNESRGAAISNGSDLGGILDNLNSPNWQCRRDGLSSLQMIIDQSSHVLSDGDLKRTTDSFTKMFHDPHSKVFSLFLETLSIFLSNYSSRLPHHWLSICLHKLVNKCGTELLGSIQVKIKRVLESIRESFTFSHQLEVMSSLVSNHTLVHNSKSRESFVLYVRELMTLVNPMDLTPSDHLNDLVSGLMELLDNYQSIELKRNIHGILLILFDLNPPTFSAVMYSQPRSVQDFMTRIAKHHVGSSLSGDEVSSSSSRSSASSNHCFTYIGSPRSRTKASLLPRPSSAMASRIPQRTDASLYLSSKRPPSATSPEVSPSSPSSSSSSSLHPRDNTRNLFVTPQVIRKVSLSRGSEFKSPRIQRTAMSQHASIRENVEQQSGRGHQNVVNHSQHVAQHSQQNRHSSDCTDEEYMAAEFNVFVEHFPEVNISNQTEWKQALKQLVQHLPRKADLITDNHLTSLLPVLLSATEDIDECSLLVADCMNALLKTRQVGRSVTILKNILDRPSRDNILQTLRWIKFQLEGVAVADVRDVLGDLVVTVLKVSDSDKKSVRTVSVMLLIQIYKLIGEEIWRHIGVVSEHKRTLLSMYFRKPTI